MAELSPSPFPVVPPTAAEAAALAVAAAYFARAGTRAASGLLDGADGPGGAALRLEAGRILDEWGAPAAPTAGPSRPDAC